MADVLDVTLEDPPDGQWWPSQFAADRDWCDDRGSARRRGDVLDLRTIGTTDTHSYNLTLTAIGGREFYLAQKEE